MTSCRRIATRIVNEVKGVNRVAYDITLQAARHDRVGMNPARPDAG